MLPGQIWGRLVKPLTFLCCASMVVGFALLSLPSEIRPIAYFFLTLGGLLLFVCLLSCLMECGLHSTRTETTGALSSARDNAAFEVPSYEEAVVSSAQGPNSDLGEPPPYSTVIPSQLQEVDSNHLSGLTGARTDRQGKSEGTMTHTLSTPVNLQLWAQLIESETPTKQSLPRLEPLTPPPAYELGSSDHDNNEENVFDDDSVFNEEGWTPP